ncbi:MAG: 5'-nucleotidase C-terminal domain-containing protein [Bacteroidia bacterium]|nr:5'-nucleotidase C-terminal domain-containing protein [Bacteroidia bacterium]
MKNKRRAYSANLGILILPMVFLFCTCKTQIQIKEIKNKPNVINKEIEASEKFVGIIQPYRKELKKHLSDTLIYNKVILDKKGKRPGLGILVADAMMFVADSIFGKHDYVVWMNRGGLRTELPKGYLTVEKIFELMPFDNTVCLVEADENILRENEEILKQKDFIVCSRGGVSAEDVINKKKAFRLLVSDFLVNGGDGLKINSDKAQCRNYLVRDAIIRYLKHKRKQTDTLYIEQP